MLLAALSVVLAFTASASAHEQADCSRVETNGERVLCAEIVVGAPPAEVWALWAEPDQLSTWLAPVAVIDMREGGLMETSYDAAQPLGDPRNILNRVVSVEPGQAFALQIDRAPPGFPHADEARALVTVIAIEPAGDGASRVRVRMRGFGEGAAFDELYAFFARGNAWTLQQLHKRVSDGPTDWRAAE